MTTTATVTSSPITASVSGASVSASVTSSSTSASASGGVGPQGPAGAAGVAGVAGVAGATGATGSAGAAGPANTLAIGTVTSGSSASATITGSSPSQTLNLVLPKGEAGNDGAAGATGSQGIAGSTGPAGPANSLSIGTVTEGAVGATITGTSPSQVLNLVLPRGNTGAAGATGSQGIQGVAGSTGAAGPANTLSIGTVSSGETAAATITGASPSQTLNLVLPKGDTGSAGVAGATGSVGPQGPAGSVGATGPQGPPASLNYPSVANFPATGSDSALYLAEDTSRIYQWESPVYVEVGVSGGGGITDGSKGDIVVSAAGAAWTIAAGAVTTADLADGAVTLAKTTGLQKSITSGTALPTGGAAGDIYLRYT